MEARNPEQANAYLKAIMQSVLKKIQDDIYKIVQEFISEYYKEKVFRGYSNQPVEYERTYQFFNSLVKSEVRETPEGYTCSIYIDYNSLDYKHTGYEVIDMINRGFHADTEMMNAEYDPNYDIYSKIHFWDDSIDKIEKTKLIVTVFEDYLIKKGIHVTKS
jgi:hypothetical protein